MQKIRVVLATGNETRHRYIASKLSEENIEFFSLHERTNVNLSGSHFEQRSAVEKFILAEQIHDAYLKKTIKKGEINSDRILAEILEFQPDFFLSYGCSIINDNVVNNLKCIKINTHLGLSPYYRGTGTNFWPIFNRQLEYCGVTFHDLTSKIDGGSIYHQFNLEKKHYETVHHLGNSLIKRIPEHLSKLIRSKLKPIQQNDQYFELKPRLYYRNSDYSTEASDLVEKNFGIIQSEFQESTDSAKIWSP